MILNEKIKVVVNGEKGECIASETYKVIARGLVNILGRDICKVLVKEFKKKADTSNKLQNSNI